MSRNKPLWKAEAALLSWGVEWSDEWLGLNSPSCHFESSDVPISAGHIHQTRCLKGSPGQSFPEQGPAIVYLHGYGGGCAEICTTFPQIRQTWPGPMFSLDLFGCGLSSDPQWEFSHGKKADTEAAENFFIEPLAEWCQASNLQSIVLVGQSLGGYLCVSFALRYPRLVNQLILSSPAGMCHEDPEDTPGGLREKLDDFFWNRGIVGKLIGFGCCRCLRLPFYKHLFEKSADGHSWVEPSLLATYFSLVQASGNTSGLHGLTAMLSRNFHSRVHPSQRLGSIALSIKMISFIFGGDKDPNSFLFHETEPFLQHRPYQVLYVADGGHNMMFGNPVGLAEAILAAALGQRANGLEFGQDALEEDI